MSSKTKRFKEKTKEILTSRHRLTEVMRFKDYAANYDQNCYHVLEKNRSTTVLINNFYGEQPQTPEPCKLPNMYWAELRDAKIIGGSDVVLTSDNKMLYDMLAQCDEYHANMTDHGLFLLFNKPHHVGKYYIYNYRHIYDNWLEKGICLASNMSNNYFHFMAQVASKMVYIQATGINKDVPLLVDERVLQVPQMKQLVEILNEDNRAIIPLRTNTLYKVNELYCIACPNIVIPNSKKGSQNESINDKFAYDARTLDDIKTKVLAKATLNDSGQLPKRIYLSRRNCNKRRLNEDELRPILEKYGFEFVYTEDMDIITQARLFNQAEHIVGASGAAFTNLVFCSKGCRVLVFLSQHRNSTCFSSLGNTKKAIMMYLAGNAEKSVLHIPYFCINPVILKSYFESIYSE
jgi:hypothetical protein